MKEEKALETKLKTSFPKIYSFKEGNKKQNFRTGNTFESKIKLPN